MIKLLFRLTLVTVFFAASMEVQAGLQEGIDAYKSKNYPAALKEFVPLAENRDPVALFYVALMYENGEGLPQDYPQAMMLYRWAADKGYAPAQCNLGVMYETEAGSDRNYKDAAFWYLKAAEQGNAPAQFNLGLMYYIGRGNDAPRSYKKAASWYLKAAEQGYVFAQNSLGKMYENGQGMPVSLMQADIWYSLASKAGNESARINKQAIETKMDPDMIEQAQALVREWQASHK